MIKSIHADVLTCAQTLLVLYNVNIFNQGRERIVLLLCRNALAVIFQKLMATRDETHIHDRLLNESRYDLWKLWITKEARRRFINFAWSMLPLANL